MIVLAGILAAAVLFAAAGLVAVGERLGCASCPKAGACGATDHSCPVANESEPDHAPR